MSEPDLELEPEPDRPAPVRLSFAHMGDYHVLIRELLSLLGCEVVVPPPITKRTLELGTKYSPECACVPYKYNLGNYLEAIERGANTFLTVGGGCRFRYYFESQRELLRDLGHKIAFFQTDLYRLYRDFKRIQPGLRRRDFYYKFLLVLKKLHLMDHIDDSIRKRIGFERREGSFERFWREFLGRLPALETFRQVRRFARQATLELEAIPTRRPQNPLRVGVVGELYLLMEPFSNFHIEKTLGKMGVEVHRWVSVSTIFHEGLRWRRHQRRWVRWAQPYVRYVLGAHGTESAARVHRMIREGFDGAIHLKPFGCMPEINAMPALYRMSREHRFPIVCFSFDSHTSEAGVKTRLEAFFDMIYYKRQGVLV